MRKHHAHFLVKLPGDAPQISSNICLLETSSKIMTFTALLHIYVSDFSADPIQITELLRSHLVAVKADIDDDAMVVLLTPIISNLLAICGHLDGLNKRCRVSENEEQCKSYLHASKSCADIIRSISTWINLTIGRAKFIVELMGKVAPIDSELVKLVRSINMLASSRFFHFAIESLTKALVAIVETATRNTFAKALMKEGCLENSFRSCLGAIRQSIAFVHACGTATQPDIKVQHSNNEWQAAAEIYLFFVVSINLPYSRLLAIGFSLLIPMHHLNVSPTEIKDFAVDHQ